MIGAYGHDDRVCAYTSLMAALEVSAPSYTTVTVFADKEETGSDGSATRPAPRPASGAPVP